MKLKKLVDDVFFPTDTSLDRIKRFCDEVYSFEGEIAIYPDVHYKKGAALVNGMLICSDFIFPACLGVENCGFTVGKVHTQLTDEQLQLSFSKYSDWCNTTLQEQKRSVNSQLNDYLTESFYKGQKTYSFLGINDVEVLLRQSKKLLNKKMLSMCNSAVGHLGGGNHFFELHRVVDSSCNDLKSEDVVFMIHSDSISIGNYINLIYSNLSELFYLRGIKKICAILKWRGIQFFYFIKTGLLFTNFLEIMNLCFSYKEYRSLNAASKLGKRLIFDHNIAGIFGEINRKMIIKDWATLNNLDYSILFSHSHDSVSIEIHNNRIQVVHRNGVQFVGNDKLFMLPGAMGTYTYILKNLNNKNAFYSANHGSGRFEDKHIAKSNYTEKETVDELSSDNIKLYRIGQGLMAEQNKHAFKDVDSVLEQMEKYSLGRKVAKTRPVAIIKG